MLREIFTGQNGQLSSKRIMGTIMVLAAIVFIGLGLGEAATVNTMLWAGVASLGVGTLETRVSK